MSLGLARAAHGGISPSLVFHRYIRLIFPLLPFSSLSLPQWPFICASICCEVHWRARFFHSSMCGRQCSRILSCSLGLPRTCQPRALSYLTAGQCSMAHSTLCQSRSQRFHQHLSMDRRLVRLASSYPSHPIVSPVAHTLRAMHYCRISDFEMCLFVYCFIARFFISLLQLPFPLPLLLLLTLRLMTIYRGHGSRKPNS